MEPWQEEGEMLMKKNQECHPEKRKAKLPQGAGGAGIELLQEQEASPFRHEVVQTEGHSFQDGGEMLGHGDTPSQESAGAKLQPQPNGFRREGPADEEEQKETAKEQDPWPTLDDTVLGKDGSPTFPEEEMGIFKRPIKKDVWLTAERRYEETLMRELSEMVQNVVKSSSWCERHGIDDTIIALNFLALPVGFILLRSDSLFPFLLGLIILGIAHHTITVKGSHLASHRTLVESKSWGKLWAVFFIEVCSAFTAEQGSYNHVKIHHGYTNVIGLGDSSTWKLPFLNSYIYMFMAPIAVPIITPLVAIGLIKEVELKTAIRTVCCMFLGLYSHYWLLRNISGFQTVWSALSCMLVTRSLLAHPYIHVNIFQHIGLPMFSADKKPKRIHMMTHGVLNLPRNPLLDWCFGHSLINCHVEHHLFPALSDHMCLKIKPIVSQYLKEKKLPYNEDSYLSRLKLFLDKYEELMVHAPPITELVGIQ
ncbi:fatty acid desaturase 6 [Hemicordylus capensis]|uniref:fatty acid desaturase 6 n=1 Tax=Hemicordylus capensis TaxID=884348 RepID=UPI002302F7F5|nr:fatty acid desaturase 6 [Hemicordylus capensis]XP_053159141.1 fatty acid desaturase 6 [Hemicordylus capensis]XP_053159142.1 fatty acid desaturase 6 [Hemicordylus capensis]XP_053159143.1 fatty acid desaturase 6 [Hemicordylus capensis]XP_053159144.1 fatty acid desaturase 6 [Hemicordylus capensis]XP_053159145.1 fatty acid desaturase 6 [Hemicordylus capensis]XP_053159146.1 fatty acid desaturase 6 [Hemicordylus capensis]XP_053159147.1 fatty acid desaturase 6 [Hemicordylus capensis]